MLNAEMLLQSHSAEIPGYFFCISQAAAVEVYSYHPPSDAWIMDNVQDATEQLHLLVKKPPQKTQREANKISPRICACAPREA